MKTVVAGKTVEITVYDSFSGTGVIKEVKDNAYVIDLIDWCMCYTNSHLANSKNLNISFDEICSLKIIS